jgi:nucleotide-binding universal stress UspA family protein
MAIRKILVPLSGQHDPDDPESLELPALETGFLLGRRFDAHVEVFCIEARQSEARTHLAPWIPGAAVDEFLDALDRENERRRERARTLFEAVSARFDPRRAKRPKANGGFSANFVEQVGEVRGSLAVRGRLADVIVTARPWPATADSRPLLLEVALRETGRPVLICSKTTSETFGRRVAIAWNGSVEASRAVAMAMDFFLAASDVVVISINEPSPFEPNADDLVDFMRWHGIEASSVTRDGSPGSAGRLLLEQIAEAGADMLVMGAYTRDRIRRLIFGDVTGTVLSQATLPVLMVD